LEAAIIAEFRAEISLERVRRDASACAVDPDVCHGDCGLAL